MKNSPSGDMGSYEALLRRSNKGSLSRTDLSPLEDRLVKELLDEGLLSDRAMLGEQGIVLMREELMTTPAGAVALAEWNAFRKANSWWGKAAAFLGRLFWLIVGVVIGSIPQLLSCFQA